MKLLAATALAALSLQLASCANILAVLPYPAKSHQAIFRPIILGLAARGHNVTFVTSMPVEKPPENLNQVKISVDMENVKETITLQENDENPITKTIMSWLVIVWCNMLIRQIGDVATQTCLKNPKFQEIIQDTNTKYDLIIAESTFSQEPLAALSHKYGAHLVEIMPTSNIHWTYSLHGNPYDTNYIMDIDVSSSDNMTFLQRLMNTVMSLIDRMINTYYYMPKAELVANKYMRYPGWQERPPLLDIIKNSSLLLINTHLAVNYPFPLSPNVKEIGGINLQPESKPLPKDIQDFMDGAKDGVIYFTLGSYIDVSTTLGENLRQEFVKAFGKIKQRVLWKWETAFPNVPANVKIAKWFPQQDVLAHKNMKLFISHGGLLSTTEAVYHGVPMIGIPIMGDQPKNVNQIKATGYGLHLGFNNLTESSILWAINDIMSNPRYGKIAKQRSAIYKDRKQTAQETAIYWIEYVLRHDGARHLKPAITSQPWCQQALLDVYICLAAIACASASVLYLMIRAVCRCMCRSKTKTNKHTKTKPKKD